MARQRHEKVTRPWSHDDMWCDETRTKCARAMVDWLKGSVNVKRPIISLSREELEAMVEVVTACYVVEASRRVAAEPDSIEAIACESILV